MKENKKEQVINEELNKVDLAAEAEEETVVLPPDEDDVAESVLTQKSKFGFVNILIFGNCYSSCDFSSLHRIFWRP